MRITDRQIEILEKFSCERLHSNSRNLSLIKKFYSERGSGLVDYLNENGPREDASGETAFYLIKNANGQPCLFFALKCGALFEPFDQQKIETQIQQAKNILEMLSNPNADEEKRRELFAELESIRQQGNMTVDQVITAVVERANSQKTTYQNALKMLENDRIREGKRPILRVGKTYSGVEITHFCTDDNVVGEMKENWKNEGFRYPIGQTLFWYKIVPIICKLQESAGCQFAFLFAADKTPDGTLTTYYNVALKFEKLQNVGTSKPFYDFCCEFMSQEVNNLKAGREFFLDNFNPDADDEII